MSASEIPAMIVALVQSLFAEEYRITQWIAALAAEDAEDAVRGLVASDHRAVVPLLIEAFEEARDEYTRFEVSIDVTNADETESARRMWHEARLLRTNIAWALGEIGDPRALDSLIAALHDPHSTACSEAAAAALRKFGDPRADAALENWHTS